MNKGKLIQNGVHLQEHEYATVKFFLELGYDIELISPSQIKSLHSPDFIMMGLPWEMKAPKGNGKYTAQNIIQAAAHQSNNIIIDLRRCKMLDNKAIVSYTKEFEKNKSIKRMKIITKSKEVLDFKK